MRRNITRCKALSSFRREERKRSLQECSHAWGSQASEKTSRREFRQVSSMPSKRDRKHLQMACAPGVRIFHQCPANLIGIPSDDVGRVATIGRDPIEVSKSFRSLELQDGELDPPRVVWHANFPTEVHTRQVHLSLKTAKDRMRVLGYSTDM